MVAAALKAANVTVQRDEGQLRIPAAELEALEDGVAGLDISWSEETRLLLEGRRWARRSRQRLSAVLRQLEREGERAAVHMLADVSLIDGLDSHQIVNVAAMTTPDTCGMCLFDEQGAGKTVSLIAAFDALVQRDEADLLLVLAPKAMLGEWARDVERFTRSLYRVGVLAGDRRAKQAVLAARPDVLVANYETAVRDDATLTALVAGHGRRTVLAVDESFHVKNPASLRSAAVRRLRLRVGRTFVLCGTPAPNHPQDVVGQVDLVDFGLTFEGVQVPDDRGDAVSVLGDVLDRTPVHRRSLKADVLPDLPPRRFHRIPVTLAPEQRRLYDAARDDLVNDLKSINDREFAQRRQAFVARRSTLLRLCSHPAGVAPSYDETPAKLAALDALLRHHVEQRGDKVVIWSFYTASLDAIARRYAGLGLVRFDGTVTSVAARRDAVRRFQEDPETRVFLGNPAAAGAGLTLHAARLAVYESVSNQAAHYLQSLDRIHRRGQNRDVEYLLLVAEQTLEEAEYDRLSAKHEVARELLHDDDELPITRTSLLAELLPGEGEVG